MRAFVSNWKLSEITIILVHAPYEDDDRREYKIPVTINPLTTERARVMLGLQLPADTVLRRGNGKIDRFAHWKWMVGAARGHRVTE
jgi:hypothetical protein